MNQIEVDFDILKDSTMVQGDIAVLFEKVQKLEITNDTNQYVQIRKMGMGRYEKTSYAS